MKKLSEINVGEEVEIIGFTNEDLQIKLMEMGFIIGEKIIIEKRAPTGDPISVLVCSYLLSLRLNEAAQIIVK